jgi:hypothetical protein
MRSVTRPSCTGGGRVGCQDAPVVVASCNAANYAWATVLIVMAAIAVLLILRPTARGGGDGWRALGQLRLVISAALLVAIALSLVVGTALDCSG